MSSPTKSPTTFCLHPKIPLNRIRNPFAGFSIPIRIHRMCHSGISLSPLEQLLGEGHDAICFHPGQFCRACGNGLWAFRLPAEDQDGFAQGGGFLLEAAGVGEDQVGPGHEVVHLGHVQGGDQVDPGVVPQEAVGAVLDHGAQVDGVHHLHVGILLHNGPDGGENGLHGGAIVLPPVAGQGDHLFSREIQAVCLLYTSPSPRDA